ncbi:MAG: RagB/SusD family nutrient uptake outer membrane protein [Bacteroidetes bacterium]|nr:RagB/SusD family nutrient uptake outer membrane protein [Bacteroidota bacterium]
MKNIRNLSIAAVLGSILLLSASCKKYLSPSPISTFDASIAFSNLPNAKAALMGSYMAMAGDYGYGIRASYYYAYDDDCIMGGGAGLDQARHQEAHYTIQAGNADIVNTFNQFYSGIERANLCIYYIPLMPQYTSGSATDKSELQRMLGEALILRAQFYFEIVRIWGDVPAQWVPSVFAKNLFLGQTPRDTIYNHILADLDQAKGLMAWRTQASSQDERFTKGTAMALRAKIALFAGGYSLRHDGTMKRPTNYLDYYKIAKTECDTLIAHREQHTLLPSFQSLWKDVIDAHKVMDASGELIMQVAMANGTNSDSKIGCQNGTKINGVGGSLGVLLPTYFYQFDSTDLRRDVTVVPFEVVQDNYGRGHNINGFYDGKFRRDWVTSPSFYMSTGSTTGATPVTLTPSSNPSIQNMQLNWPLIRFSDVLLMDAEADNEINGGPSAAAISYYTEVSKRGHGGNATLVPAAPTNHDDFFKLIVRERSLEFGGEGIRKYDLIRWNLLGKAIAETKANLAILALPTPTDMKQLSYQTPQPTYTLGSHLPDSLFSVYSVVTTAGSTINVQPAPTTSAVFTSSYYAPATSSAAIAANYAATLGPVKTLTFFKLSWRGYTAITTTFVNYYGFGYVAGHSELYPFPQASIDANNNLRPQNPGY